MRVTTILSLFAIIWSAAAVSAADGPDVINVRGILVQCLNEPGRTDQSLAQFEPNLRRLLPFESFRSAGQGSARLAVPGTGTVSIGGGNRLEIEILGRDGDRVRARVRWIQRDRELMNTVLNLNRGVPAVLGRGARGSQDDVYAALIIVR